MKFENVQIGSNNNYRRILLAATLAGLAVVAGACTTKSEKKAEAVQPKQIATQPATSQVATSTAPPAKVEAKTEKAAVKKPASKTLRYKSRDYAVSFEYPWQYSIASAKTVHQLEALQPKSDGHDGQITLARVDLPNGFYPDSNFQSGYFTLSLNPQLKENDCRAAFKAEKSAKTAKINDADFVWVETDQTGKGGASKVRSYVAFTNDVCYEFELGVKTRNENGLAREVKVDQVMQRLEGMLKTVKFADLESNQTLESDGQN
jgi:hypothetical protein